MMSKLLAIVAVIAIIGSASAASDGFKKMVQTRGALPAQALPREGGICHDAYRGYECPLYEYFRDGVGFEFRAYLNTYALTCPRVGTVGQAYENLQPCLGNLQAYFAGANSANLVINQTAPIGIEVAEYNVGYEIFTVIFFFPNDFGKIPDPRVGSGLVVTPIDDLEIVSATFAPTDIFGQGGASVGDHQLYDAAGTLEYRASRRGIPVVRERFVFGAYNPDRTAIERANLRHEVWLVLNFGRASESFGKTALARLNSTLSA